MVTGSRCGALPSDARRLPCATVSSDAAVVPDLTGARKASQRASWPSSCGASDPPPPLACAPADLGHARPRQTRLHAREAAAGLHAREAADSAACTRSSSSAACTRSSRLGRMHAKQQLGRMHAKQQPRPHAWRVPIGSASRASLGGMVGPVCTGLARVRCAIGSTGRIRSDGPRLRRESA